ncbi:MAG TPA: phosphoenolpyruvate synthase [Patescibacteria group bacterium]
MAKYVVNISEVDKEDIPLVGGKGANLGEMTQAKLPVPGGFIVTSAAYFDFVKSTKIDQQIKETLTNLNYQNYDVLKSASSKLQRLISTSKVSVEIEKEIKNAYKKLGRNTYVAVRSSATAEDLPEASFAGQQATFLNVKGENDVVKSVLDAWASLFTERAIFYREEQKFDHTKVGIAVPVQKMVNSEFSGVCFSVDPITNNKDLIIIEGIYGLGEMIVSGAVTPDHYEVDKNDLEIVNKQLSTQREQLIRSGGKNKHLAVSKAYQDKQKISDQLIIEVARLAKKLEKHYFFPQDIEWAIEKNKVFIVQTRPITTLAKSDKANTLRESQELKSSTENLNLILEGSPASPGVGTGKVIIVLDPKEINKVKKGDVLVAPMTNPDYVPAMRKATAVVTDKGGRTSHAAIVSRELGIPAVVGTEQATDKLKEGQIVTVDGANGKVYRGAVKLVSKQIQPNAAEQERISHLKTATKIYLNLGEPERAEELAKKNVDGVGLLRAEFMIAEIGIHPKKLIADKKSNLFIDKLSEGLETFCRAFGDRPVIYRATDFKTNEYRNLKGGEQYEPQEENPMLGFRGAFRYVSHPEVFKLEIEAIKNVRNKKGYKNLHLMIPFVRTVDHLVQVKKILAVNGLNRSHSFRLYLMVEIPSNIILMDKFVEVGIDGISIGSNDLTMLILGVDRDNEELASVYDERNEAVLWALEKAVTTAKKLGVTSSICGQAPSTYPDLTEKLVSWGITSVSINPDVIDKTREIVYAAEHKLVHSKD